MGHHVGQIDEERSGGVALDEGDRAGGAAGGELRLVGIELDDFFTVVERERRHFRGERRMVFGVVVGVGDAEPFVEAVAQRVKFEARAEVPFADAEGGVTPGLEHLGHGPLGIGDTVAAGVVVGALHAESVGVDAGHECGARGGAHGLGDIVLGETRALGGHAVEVRGLEAPGALRAHVGVAHVVDDDENDVGRSGLGGASGRGGTSKKERKSEG